MQCRPCPPQAVGMAPERAAWPRGPLTLRAAGPVSARRGFLHNSQDRAQSNEVLRQRRTEALGNWDLRIFAGRYNLRAQTRSSNEMTKEARSPEGKTVFLRA